MLLQIFIQIAVSTRRYKGTFFHSFVVGQLNRKPPFLEIVDQPVCIAAKDVGIVDYWSVMYGHGEFFAHQREDRVNSKGGGYAYETQVCCPLE
jgi:hypothetical protein